MRAMKRAKPRRKGKPVRETFLRKYCYLYGFSWYVDEVHRMIARGHLTKEQCKHLFPKTRRQKEVEEWEDKKRREACEGYSQEQIDYLVTIGYLKADGQ